MLSVVVNFYNNRREAMNTLHSLTRAYQRDAGAIEFEVIALDHGSSQPLEEADVRAFGPEFQYRFIETKLVSPAAAINAACRAARGDHLLVVIDGAHILSPGIYSLAQRAFVQFASPFVASVSFHLGPKQQNESVIEGYNQQVEDGLLARSGWRDNGYRLYTIAGAFADPGMGWFGCAFEAGCFGIGKDEYLALGGFDERFVARGGGLVALDFFSRRRRQQRDEGRASVEGIPRRIRAHPWQTIRARAAPAVLFRHAAERGACRDPCFCRTRPRAVAEGHRRG
jgi:hypothetical protein